METFLQCETMCREPPPGHVFVRSLAEIDPRKVAEVVRRSGHIKSDIRSPIMTSLTAETWWLVSLMSDVCCATENWPFSQLIQVKRLPLTVRVRRVHQRDPDIDLTGHRLRVLSVDDASFLRANAINGRTYSHSTSQQPISQLQGVNCHRPVLD